MTFGELAQFLVTELGPDGDSTLALPDAEPYFSSAFGIRVAALLSMFTRETFYLWTVKEAITVTAGDREFSFADPANCALNFHYVEAVWLSGVRLCRETRVHCELAWWTPDTPAGTPMRFAQLDSQRIMFDLEVAADPSSGFAMGYYRHPAIASDDDEVLLAPEDAFLFETYAAANIRRNVAADDVGMARLQAVAPAAAALVRKLRGEKMRRMGFASQGQYGW